MPVPARPAVSKPSISLILAADRGGVIGRDGGLPWRLPDDLRHFKATTLGSPVVMGRRTWDEMKTPLVGRRNIVVSRQPELELEGAVVAHDVPSALTIACTAAEDSRSDEVFVIGGAEIFAQTLALAGRIHLTWVDAELEGDTRVPLFWQDEATWELRDCRPHEIDERHAYRFEIRLYERRG